MCKSNVTAGLSGTHPVSDEVSNAGEYFTCDDNPIDDGTQSFASKNNVRGSVGGIGRTLHGNTNIGTLQRRGIVNTVSSTADRVATFAKAFNHQILHARRDECVEKSVEKIFLVADKNAFS